MKTLISIFLFLAIVACGQVTQQIIKLDDENAARTVVAAMQIMKHMEMNSMAIREALDAFKKEIPQGFYETLTKLDRLAAVYADQKTPMTEHDAGRIVILATKLAAPAVQEAVKQFAPKIWGQFLKYIPALAAAAT